MTAVTEVDTGKCQTGEYRKMLESLPVFMNVSDDAFIEIMDFIAEIDKLKTISRQTLILDGTRYENDAEHSWHISVMAPLLIRYLDGEAPDLLKTIKMALIHDMVEIFAGDTYCYDKAASADKKEREEAAAKRLFGILPDAQAEEFLNLWHEFEEMKTIESAYAAALDKLQPLIHNYLTDGKSWKLHGVYAGEVRVRISQLRSVSLKLWEFADSIISMSVSKGYLKAEPIDKKMHKN
ncbi:MAG: HD domain-containing protein [Eubacteriales bacterium]|nr:HD domain-containing protein [Eubacteriales bacterium]